MAEDLSGALVPLLSELDIELVDVEVVGGTLRVTVDRPGGIDLDAVAHASRVVSRAVDELDPVPGRYTLEVSSPGLERRLRTPAHFAHAVGSTVTVRTNAALGDDGTERTAARRLQGRLESSDQEGFVLRADDLPGGEVRLAYREVERARTVFEWGPAASGGTKHARGERRR